MPAGGAGQAGLALFPVKEIPVRLVEIEMLVPGAPENAVEGVVESLGPLQGEQPLARLGE